MGKECNRQSSMQTEYVSKQVQIMFNAMRCTIRDVNRTDINQQIPHQPQRNNKWLY